MYRTVPAKIDLPEMEHEILAFWDREQIFDKTLAQTETGPTWVFFEGPPTANGAPGTHHVEARVFKDVFPRYKTMRGYNVPRKAGWDCHGLPVELAVEKELGFTGKKDIEEFGIADFNARCRESVLRHVDQFTALTQRMGYWVDMDSAYWTMDASYVQSVWWSLKKIFDDGLLVSDHRVAPWCPRCGTTLSDHELAQGYEDVVDPSVYVRLPVTDQKLSSTYPNLNLIIWTTTPWTLVSNTAVAVAPDATYVVAKLADGSHAIVADALRTAVLGDDHEVVATLSGRELERVTYQRPFDFVEIPDSHFVVSGDYVTTEDGTGLVHLAPAFGADDLQVCREFGLPVVNPVNADGTFRSDVELVGGTFFKTADTQLVANLDERGLLFRQRDYEHSYPHCWRCHTPLMYYAQPSWYIRTTAIKDKLLAANEATNWYPETIKEGRFGDWLRNNIDWALSRNRYWGTPLPIWRCEDDHLTCIGSLAELGDLAGQDLSELDPHRPYVDDVSFPCPQCEQTAHRVPEVIDGWYDSGAMPFAQWGYPLKNADVLQQRYPADFICEAIDQTRGWFYTLMAVGVLTFDESSYKNVLCLGHILDENGRKMSKHLGNILPPIPLMDEHGADAVRWFMLCGGSAWQARRVGHQTIAETVRKTLLTYWNTVSFQALYGRIAEFDPTSNEARPVSERSSMDRWALSAAHACAAGVTEALDNFDTQHAGRLIADYVDELSNWYVRRSRRRFWDSDADALATLHECLRILTLLMAPFTPFITERVWDDLFVATNPAEPESVHLASWPQTDTAVIDLTLNDQMSLVRRLTELGRAARAESKLKTRQPLRRALVAAPGWADVPTDLTQQLTEELNVLDTETLDGADTSLVEVSVKANYRQLGKRFAKQTPHIAALIEATDPAAIALQLRTENQLVLEHEGEAITLSSEDVLITETPREGWAVATDLGETLALDLALDDELRALGTARDVVREIQEARKQSGFDVTDRITVTWSSSDPAIIAAVNEHADVIAAEVLATSFAEAPAEHSHVSDSIDLAFSLETQAAR